MEFGTKLISWLSYDKHDTIGQDRVAMCVNDINAAGCGASFTSLTMSPGDWKNVNQLNPEQVVRCEGCAQALLIGGETAEMPGMYEKMTTTLAGFAVGVH